MRALGPARPCALLVVLGALLGGCAGGTLGDASGTFEPRTPGTLTVITQPLPSPGFWEGRGDRPTGGLEYGMAQDLADRFGLGRVVVRTAPFARIVAGGLGDADLAMALITQTGEREDVLDFSAPYFNSPPALLVRSGTEVPDVETAQELRWGLIRGTTFEDVVEETIQPDEDPLLFSSRRAEVEALLSGRVEVAMLDLPAAQALAQARPRLAVEGKLSRTEPIAIALPDGSENVDAVSSAVRAMIADGTLDELAERWLGASVAAGEESVPLLRTSEP